MEKNYFAHLSLSLKVKNVRGQKKSQRKKGNLPKKKLFQRDKPLKWMMEKTPFFHPAAGFNGINLEGTKEKRTLGDEFKAFWHRNC